MSTFLVCMPFPYELRELIFDHVLQKAWMEHHKSQSLLLSDEYKQSIEPWSPNIITAYPSQTRLVRFTSIDEWTERKKNCYWSYQATVPQCFDRRPLRTIDQVLYDRKQCKENK
jgi:hypothetical protein